MEDGLKFRTMTPYLGVTY